MALSLLASLVGGCGGAASTDTGNPPVVGQGLRLTATETGVVISGEAGSVPAGARVDVVNTATGQTATTTAEADGSFALEVDGAVTDEYRVYTASGAESWRTRLTSSGAAAPEAGLAGLRFLLSSSIGFNPVPGTTPLLAFNSATELSLSAGCNSQFGTYSLCDGKLCVSDLASTNIGCDAPLQTQDEWMARFLGSSPVLTQAGATLTLTGSDETLIFLDREVADADRSLAGRTWSVDTFIENGAATNTPFAPTMLFGDDGTLRVFVDCNTSLGSYTRSGQTLTLSGMSYTDRECKGGNAQLVPVSRVMTDGEVSFEIDAARLTITRGTLGLSATTE